MYQTAYHRPTTLADAEKGLATATDGKLLAGGHTLIPTMKQRLAAPSDLIDISHLSELQGIEVTGDAVTIGAAVTHAEVNASVDVRKTIPALAELAGHIGDPHVRHMGTLGGSLANNDPAADYPAAVLGLDATIHTNRHTFSAGEFFKGLFTTVLDGDEIITKIAFKIPQKAAYAKFPNPASRYAMAGVFVGQLRDGSVRVAVTGASRNGVFRWRAAEDALAAGFDADAIANLSVDEGDMLADIHGNATYRANLVAVMTKRAVTAA
jgi:aerobic carbon-monoxide dehydrogenase medium subunit